MALNPSRSAPKLTQHAIRACRASRTAPATASFSTSCVTRSEAVPSSSQNNAPRWSRTPERMKAPFSPHITKDPARSRWKVNEDPKRLDKALNQFFGHDGERLLPDELKWLAVTHKSFDQGRRGFNDRLAFLGRQICTYEATQSILTSPAQTVEPEADPYAHLRTPFEHPELRSLDNLTLNQPSDIFTFEKLAALAVDTGVADIVRWKPRMPENIQGSGFAVVVSGAVYALVGAIAMQHGGKVASRIVRERIIKKLPK
ncbi:RNase III domain-containing protein [Microdochium trichocladiopsis]|uniref:RNase III domain-containing protein n=1 Tax=Microdochium trichocladiopsis TaxID=1682393 RepID=A0A9P8YC41_9PEZI|nr:RNase III domain-containing protein [Microdochium trichocladiopsis]KAH7033584.1 RNase III domain-containing protein [Microdochium trichocladiopsis]